MARRTNEMSWEALQQEVRRLRALGNQREDLENTIRELEIYQEEVERQNRELIETQGVLESSRERYAALFDAAPVGYVTLDARGVIEEANLLAARLFGLPRHRLVGTPLVALLGWDQLLGHLEATRRSEDPVRARVRVRRHDGEPLSVEICSRVAERGDGIRMILTDLAPLDRAEAERRDLEVSARVAREANDAKDRFIAMLSHELRTPLTPVLASLEILEAEAGLSETARIEIARIRRNVSVEVRLIHDLLDVVRISRGAVQLERERVELPGLIAELLESLGPDARKVRVSLADSLQPVLADPVRLRQILTNLLRNALDATCDGGEVDLRAEASGDGLRIEVRDSGVGIEPARLERIFTAFERDESPGSRTGGLGLGLVICQALTKAHGGRLHAASDGRGKGARFTVTLPTGFAAGPTQPASLFGEADAKAPAPPSNGDASRSPPRLLLVDDHPDTAHSLGKLLERRGYEVHIASSLAEALAAAHDGFDVIVSDLALGDGTGHELIERLRERGCEKPAIAVSGFGSEVDVERSLAAGFREHLTKPIRIDRLTEALARATGTTPR